MPVPYRDGGKNARNQERHCQTLSAATLAWHSTYARHTFEASTEQPTRVSDDYVRQEGSCLVTDRKIPVDALPTPALLLDLDAMEANLAAMATFFRHRQVKLRPHFKNHRVLALADRQLGAGAIGITCARLWQAEALVAHGITNVLLANEIAGAAPVRELSELSQRAPVIVAVDNLRVVGDMARAARNARSTINVGSTSTSV